MLDGRLERTRFLRLKTRLVPFLRFKWGICRIFGIRAAGLPWFLTLAFDSRRSKTQHQPIHVPTRPSARTNLPPLSRFLLLPIPLGMDLRPTPGEPVLQGDAADGAVSHEEHPKLSIVPRQKGPFVSDNGRKTGISEIGHTEGAWLGV